MTSPTPVRRKNRRRWLIAVAICAVAVTAVIILRRRDDGPVYEGKPLRYWVERLDDHKSEIGIKASQVLSNAGPEAVPFLVKLLVDKKSRPEQWKNEFSYKLDEIAPGIGSLIPVQYSYREEAYEALKCIGPKAIPALASAYDSDDPETRTYSIIAISAYETDSRPGLHVLLKALKDPNVETRFHAAFALRYLKTDAEIIVPALAEVVSNDAQPETRGMAAAVLSKHFLEDAAPAIPLLTKALNDTDSIVRMHAERALKKIAPQVLESTTKDKTDGPIR